jgi:hypothetical protein
MGICGKYLAHGRVWRNSTGNIVDGNGHGMLYLYTTPNEGTSHLISTYRLSPSILAEIPCLVHVGPKNLHSAIEIVNMTMPAYLIRYSSRELGHRQGEVV